MKVKNQIWLCAIMLSVCMITGCGTEDEQSPVQIQGEKMQSQGSQMQSQGGQTQSQSSQTQSQESQIQIEHKQEGQGFSFADVSDREFYFSSGAGGWYTVLYIHEDGTFDGHFQDSDMGDADLKAYPNGTIYFSEFSGSFTEPVKVDDTTYSFQIKRIVYPYGFGDEIKDGYHYCYSTGYGLDGAQDLYMYLPGAKIADLPEAYRSWVGYYNLESISETELPFYGLYNVTQENGFSSYVMQSAAESMEAVVSFAEGEETRPEEKLQNAQTQTDMNLISGDIYTVWDNALNSIWQILKENLDEESMKKLTEEERNWIAEKEAAVKEAAAEYEAGSIAAMDANQKAAEMTKERVYELMKCLQ